MSWFYYLTFSQWLFRMIFRGIHQGKRWGLISACPNAGSRLLSGVGYRDWITPALKELYRLPICFQAQLKMLVLTFWGHKQSEATGLEEPPPPTLSSLLVEFLPTSPLLPPPAGSNQEQYFSETAVSLWSACPLQVHPVPILFSMRLKLKHPLLVFHCPNPNLATMHIGMYLGTLEHTYLMVPRTDLGDRLGNNRSCS